MFSPRQKSTDLNSSLVKSPSVMPSRTRRSLYAPRNKSFFSPQTTGRNKNQNASEFQLTLNKQPTDYKLSIYGGWMPVNVNEILSNIEGLPPRAKINNNGLVWIVAKDKLLLWSISQEKSNACYELHLPFVASEREADDIVLVATTETDDIISCLAVTSEGSAVFWNCVAYPRSFVEVKVLSSRGSSDFCVDLVAIADGFLVGWLSGTLTYIQISQGQPKQMTLRAQQGRLTNISRRFSSIIFGSSQGSSSSQQIGSLKRLLPGDCVEESGCELFVLLESHLQKWVISFMPFSEKLVYEINLEILVNSSMKELLGIESEAVILQDIQLTRSGLSILFASITNSVAKYGITLLDTAGSEPPVSAAKVLMSNVESPLLGDGEPKTYKLLWPDRFSDTNCFFYNSESIVCFKDNEEEAVTCEAVNFSSIGAGCYCGLPLFLSNQGTLVKVQESVVAANQSVADSLLKSKTFSNVESSVLGNTSVVRLSELSQSKDPLTRFKAIFISTMCNPSSTQQLNKTASMLSELFSSTHGEMEQLDSLVIYLSREMIDDCPSNDPRWAESRTSEMSVVSSTLILSHQLDDKLKAQEAFLCFLKSNNLWDRLGMFALREGQAPTGKVLCENSEKLVAATALKNVHHDWSEVVDPAMKKCIEKRKSFISAQGSLKPQDIFYKEVSKLPEIFEQLVEVERLQLGSRNVEMNPQTLHLVHGVSAIFRDVLGKALSFRRSKADFYTNSVKETKKNSSGFKSAVPWTSADSIMMPLFKQHAILCNEVIPLITDAGQLNALFRDLLDITDLILDGMVTVIDSLGDSEKSRKEDLHKKYEHTRTDLLAPFVRHNQLERATSLAEKYCDFELLVQICDALRDECRLEEYMKKFDGMGFPEVVFDWYCKTGKRGKLFAPKVIGHPRLAEFLRRPENRFMSWVYDVLVKNYSSAHETCFELAQIETSSITKRRTLLSSAKLYALLAKDPSFDVEERIIIIDNNLQLISHQETIFQNEGVLKYLAIDSFSASRVYSALELIDLQIGSCIEDANEYDFKKGFDLLKFCNNEDEDHPVKDIVIDIWVKAILRDDWKFSLSITDPVSSCRNTIFFKFLELVLGEVSDIEAVLPSLDELLEHEDMECYRSDTEFRCKLMVIYEHARRMNI